MKKIGIGLMAASFLGFGGMSYVQASEDIETAPRGLTTASYSTTVGSFGGSGYTGYQKKERAGQKADLYSTKTGNYKIDARTNSAGSNGTWSNDIYNKVTRQLANSHNKGTNTRVQFKNKLTTPVNTQASGSWRSN